MSEHTSVQLVIDVCVQAFNACAPDLGYSDWSAAQLPVRPCHLTEKGTGYTTSDCRQLTTYVIATHYVTRDPFVGRERLLTYSAIGDLFGRTHGWASYALVEACKMLEDPKWKKVYQNMVDALVAQGCELWNAKVTGECAKRA